MEEINMYNIDDIMDMLDWNNSVEIQAQGLKLARNVKTINVFLQPLDKRHNKNVWDNCAKILSDRTDQELTPYLIPLLEWLQDLNWPGALCILERMNTYSDNPSFGFAFHECMKIAKATDDEVWLNNLLQIDRKIV